MLLVRGSAWIWISVAQLTSCLLVLRLFSDNVETENRASDWSAQSRALLLHRRSQRMSLKIHSGKVLIPTRRIYSTASNLA